MNVLLPTDVFPPRSGGAGWSAHTLARALQARGHRVTALVPRLGDSGVAEEQVLGVPTLRYGYRAPPIPFVKNYFRHERLWPGLARALVKAADGDWPTVIHAQHVQVAPAAVMAGQRLGAPVIVTVRDHWPWDYFATGLHGDQVPYTGQTWAALATDLVAREGPLRGATALPAIPYILAHLRRRQAFLRQADAVIAVSDYIAGRLRAVMPPERIHVIPNMLDFATIDEAIATPPVDAPPCYMLFVGKLERNKGAHLLIDILRELRGLREPADIPPLLVAGDGPLRGEIERGLGALGVGVRFLEWVEHDEVLRLMAGSTLLLFPSAWGEPLSRVPLEAGACAATVVAMPTGGTPDIIADGANGALEPTPQRFARRVHVLLSDEAERLRLGAAARANAAERFGVGQVVGRVERLYEGLLASRS